MLPFAGTPAPTGIAPHLRPVQYLWELIAQKVIDKQPTSQRDLALVQQAFNQWHAESGRPLCQLSVMLAHTVNH